MNKLIGICGLNCETCQARVATINNDNNLREEVAKEWSLLNKVEITPGMINCVGCLGDGVKTPFCDKLCQIKQCAINKKIETCADCIEMETCQKLAMITSNNENAKLNLEMLKQEK